MKKLIIGSLIAATSLFASTGLTNNYYYDIKSQCVKDKENDNCQSFEDLSNGTDTTAEFEINGVPGYTVNSYIGEHGSYGEALYFNVKNERLNVSDKVDYVNPWGRISSVNIDPEIISAGPLSNSINTPEGQFNYYNKRIDQGGLYAIYKGIDACNKKEVCANEAAQSLHDNGYSTEGLTGSTLNLPDLQPGVTSDPEAPVEVPTYTTGETNSYTPGDNGKVDTPLSNGAYLHLSKDNSAEITDLVCSSGENGFEIIISNTKLNETVSYNSCTDAKIKWTEGATNTEP